MRLAIYILVRAKAVIDLALGVIAHARHPAYDAGIFVALLQRLDRLFAVAPFVDPVEQEEAAPCHQRLPQHRVPAAASRTKTRCTRLLMCGPV